jgi:hypothetical protein
LIELKNPRATKYKRARATLLAMSAAADMEREAGELAAFLNSLPSDAEDIDLSSFELIEDFDDEAWMKLGGFKDTMKRVKLPPSLLTIRVVAFSGCSQLTEVTFPSCIASQHGG